VSSLLLAVALFSADYRWERTPHQADGYWSYQSPEQLGWKWHPFGRYTWSWKGQKPGERTLIYEGPPNAKLERPKLWRLVPLRDPFLPGQKYNL